MQYNNTVVVLRGISGSGKDTWIKNNIDNARICCADDFFMKDGEYVHDVYKLSEAHSWCMSQFLKAVHEHVPTIVVNNTHIRCWEWENYARVALLSGYDVEVVTLACTTISQIQTCFGRNLHKTPLRTIASCAARFEDTTKCSADLVNRIKSTVV